MDFTTFNQIKWKLTSVIMGTSAIVLGLGCIAVLVYDSVASKRYLVSRVATMAEIAAANCSAAMAFINEDDAREIMKPLCERNEIDFAGLFFNDGSPFVLHATNGVTHHSIQPLEGQSEGHYFTVQDLFLKRSVILGDDQVGFIVVGANRTRHSTRSRAFLLIACLVMIGLTGVALLLGARLQRLVSEPIAQLAAAAHEITVKKDYSIRVPKTSNDEVGSLVLAFNEMLTEIERQNHVLVESENRLKLALSASKMGTWEWDLNTDCIVCSNEAKSIFGCASNEASLAEFARLIHPEDADKVMDTLMESKASNELLSLEYRVRTSDQKTVWVSHVGRIQHDAAGQPKTLSGIVQDVTSRKHIEADRQKLTANLLHAEEEERRRIARELHDTTAQHLAALKINFARLSGGPPDPALAYQSRQLLEQALQELRTLTYVLHPPVLEEFGLVGALTDFATGVTRRNGVKVTVNAREYHGRMSATAELALFRVVQESVTNAIRHSGTKEILITLSRDTKETRLSIRDFGHGITRRSTSLENSGVGIASMKERLTLIGGRLSIASADYGVTVLASVPATTQHAAASPAGRVSS